jgi:glycosyltransferase involved in cell wall biosynthesis
MIGQFRCGGSERQLYWLLKRMECSQFHPHVVVWNFSDDQQYVSPIRSLGVPIHGFPEAVSNLSKLWRLRCLVVELKPEILHSYSFYLNAAAYWATYRTNTIPFGSVRSNFASDIKSVGLLRGHLSARWPRNQICNSVSALNFAKQSKSPFMPERLVMVRNGLDLNNARWCPIPSRRTVSILGIGSLIPSKRWDRLVAAASELKKRKLEFSVRIVGDGPLRSALEEQTRKLRIDDRVTFLGQSDDILGLLGDSTLLAHTSDVEGCPNVVMEAMALGRPVVATDVGDVSFLVEDGKTGFIVQRQDLNQFVECLETLIANRDLCQRMGEAGRSKALHEFGLDRLVSETFAAYETAGWKG